MFNFGVDSYPEMKKLLVILLMTTLNSYSQSNAAASVYVIARFKQYYNSNQPDSIFKMFAPQVRTLLPADKNKQMLSQLKAQLGDLKDATYMRDENGIAIYKASFDKSVLAMKLNVDDKNQIAGLLFDNYNDGKAEPQAGPLPGDSPYISKGLFGSEISGTLLIPPGTTGKVPVVLIIPGSGPTDRDGNSPKLGLNTNAYRMLAEALSKNGIASLRYDKKLVGRSVSTTKESQLKIEDYVEDAGRIMGELHEDKRFSKLIVLGHSEGSLVGILASIEGPANGFISVAGAGRPAYFLLKEQMKSQPDYISTRFNTILDSLVKGKLQNNVDASLYAFARPSIQLYIMSWLRYDPYHAIHRLKIPVLILQGTTDLQVGTIDADKLKKAKSDAELDIIPNMNHIMKEAPADRDKNLATYNDPNLPLKPELVTDILNFIGKLK